MFVAVHNHFARRAPVPPLSHTSPGIPETAQQRMEALVRAGMSPDTLAVEGDKLYLVCRSGGLIPL